MRRPITAGGRERPVHIAGFALLLGSTRVLDAVLIVPRGAEGPSAVRQAPTIPWTLIAFTMASSSGGLLYMADAVAVAANPAFPGESRVDPSGSSQRKSTAPKPRLAHCSSPRNDDPYAGADQRSGLRRSFAWIHRRGTNDRLRLTVLHRPPITRTYKKSERTLRCQHAKTFTGEPLWELRSESVRL